MTTLVIHGTLARGASWYWNSWKPGGFCHAVAEAMERVSGWHDVWRVNGQSIAAAGRFEWSGMAEGLFRGEAARELVQYLNGLGRQTDEDIRIIAHSHGCNVVKLASANPELKVHIDKAVFLACPHFWETSYEAEEPKSWLDKFKFELLKPRGRKYRYGASPQRFGRILNLYSESDLVQLELAQSLSGSYVPTMTGDFLGDLKRMISTGDVYEIPTAERTDSDPLAGKLYVNSAVRISTERGRIAVHAAMHSAAVGMICGAWLNSDIADRAFQDICRQLPEIPANDTGD
jgi:hypothetical protein